MSLLLPPGHASSFCEAVRVSPALDLVGTPRPPPQVAGRNLIYYFVFLNVGKTSQHCKQYTLPKVHQLLLLSPVLAGDILCYHPL